MNPKGILSCQDVCAKPVQCSGEISQSVVDLAACTKGSSIQTGLDFFADDEFLFGPCVSG